MEDGHAANGGAPREAAMPAASATDWNVKSRAMRHPHGALAGDGSDASVRTGPRRRGRAWSFSQYLRSDGLALGTGRPGAGPAIGRQSARPPRSFVQTRVDDRRTATPFGARHASRHAIRGRLRRPEFQISEQFPALTASPVPEGNSSRHGLFRAEWRRGPPEPHRRSRSSGSVSLFPECCGAWH
jgi:hypothetical protein